MSEMPIEDLLERIQRHLDTIRDASLKTSTLRRGGAFSETVYERLEEAGVLSRFIYVQPFLTPSHLPVIGKLLQKVRGAIHELVIFYVNQLAGVQGAFNREVVGCLAALVNDVDVGGQADVRDEIAALRDETQTLRAQVEALQSLVVARNSGQE